MSGLAGGFVPQLYGIALAGAEGEDGKFVTGLQPGFLYELPHHVGRHVAVDGVDNAYLVGLEVIFALLHLLGDAEQGGLCVGQLARHVETIAGAGKVEDDAAGLRSRAG